jgi:hypothetical protein
VDGTIQPGGLSHIQVELAKLCKQCKHEDSPRCDACLHTIHSQMHSGRPIETLFEAD